MVADAHPNAPRRAPKSTGKVLPHNADAEASILGGLILKNELLPLLATLETRDFYLPQHQVVFDAIRNLEAAKQPVDVTTLEVEIQKRGKLDSIGGVAFFAELTFRCPTVDNVLAYTKIVRDHSMLRRLAIKASEIEERVYGWEYEADELLGDGIAGFETIRREYQEASDDVPMISIGGSLEQLHHFASKPVYPTPFPELNKVLGFDGMIATQSYVIVSGTGGGKTSFAAELARFTASNHVDVIIASYEMPSFYYVARMAGGELGVDSNDILRENVRASEVQGALPRRIHFLDGPTVAVIRKAVQKIKRSGRQAPLVIVDYIQSLAERVACEMERPDPRIANGQVSRELIALATEEEIPLVAISATSRSTSDKLADDVRSLPPRALVGSAKESSQIEYDCAAVINLSTSDESDMDGVISTVTVSKARFGSTCHLDARYDGARGRWAIYERVAFVPKSAKQAPSSQAANEASKAIRDVIVRVLKQTGPLKSKTKIYNLTGRSKVAVMSEIDAMLKDGALIILDANLALPEHGVKSAPPPQTELPDPAIDALIREAKESQQ